MSGSREPQQTVEQQPKKPLVLNDPTDGRSFKEKFWEEWIDKPIVIQTKGRALIFGIFKRFESGFLRIEEAEIRGVKNLAHVHTLMVNREHIGHFHEPATLEKLETKTTDELIRQMVNQMPRATLPDLVINTDARSSAIVQPDPITERVPSPTLE